MVSITVIMAAIIAAYVFGMTGEINKIKTIAVTASQPDNDHIIVTFQGGKDQKTFTGGNVTVTPSDGVFSGMVHTLLGIPGV